MSESEQHSDETLQKDMEKVVNEALRLLRSGKSDSEKKAVATAIGNVIPNDHGGETYKADLLVRTIPLVEEPDEVVDTDRDTIDVEEVPPERRPGNGPYEPDEMADILDDLDGDSQ